MAKRKRKPAKSSAGKKRTITPEHLAKMQAGRKYKATMEKREQVMKEKGLLMERPETKTSRMLRSMKRQG